MLYNTSERVRVCDISGHTTLCMTKNMSIEHVKGFSSRIIELCKWDSHQGRIKIFGRKNKRNREMISISKFVYEM